MGLHVVSGTTLSNRYLLIDRLAEGGYSEVFTALDTNTGDEVVVKFQSQKDVNSTGQFEEFGMLLEQEAALGDSLGHIDGLARTIDRGDLAGRKFLVVEKISGITLEDYRLRRIPVRSPFASSVIYQLAAVLQAIHESGYVHRDIKTENALIQWDGHVRLIDLGIAAPIDPFPEDEHEPGGTTGYRAPEQYDRWGEITPRADIYSLGCILFEMSVMRLPYQHYDGCPSGDIDPLPDRRRLAQMPEPLRALGLAMITHDPADRPQSMAEVCEALRPLIPPVGAEAEPDAGDIDPTAPLRQAAPIRRLDAYKRTPPAHGSL